DVTRRLSMERALPLARAPGRAGRRAPRVLGVALLGAVLLAAWRDGLALPAFVSHFRSYPVEGSPRTPVIADLNGDRIPDLAAANFGRNSVSVLLGTGGGAF